MRFVLTPALAAGLALALAPPARAPDEEQGYKKITVKQKERVLRDLATTSPRSPRPTTRSSAGSLNWRIRR